MSREARDWAWATPDLGRDAGTPTRRLVLLYLAERADRDGRCWPSKDEIADATGLHRATVSQHLAWLSQHKLITTYRRSNDQGRRISDMIELAVSKGGLTSSQTTSSVTTSSHTTSSLEGDHVATGDVDTHLSNRHEPSSARARAHDAPTRGRAREARPGTEDRPAVVATAGNDLLAGYRGAHDKPVPRDRLALVGRKIDELLAEGYTQDQIRAGLRLLVARPTASPFRLPDLVYESMNGSRAVYTRPDQPIRRAMTDDMEHP